MNGAAQTSGEPNRTSAARRLTGIALDSFRLFVENSTDGILVVDRDGAILYANPAASVIFGRPSEKLVGIPFGRPMVASDVAEITVHRPGQETREVEMRVAELVWDGEPALLASLRDVSAVRAHEDQQRQSQKLEAIGRLAAGIVHDFNNLLAVLQAGLRQLSIELKQYPYNPKIEFLIDEIFKRTRNAEALTQQLLAFSRRQSLVPEHIDVNERIRSLSSLLAQTLGRGIDVAQKLNPSLPHILIDGNQLDVAILNLAINAKDAMAGTGTLVIETGFVDSPLSDQSTADPEWIRISVRDTGCGMSETVAAQVFEPFFTTKSDGAGTGLGLSQVYGFVTQSGGQVRLESEVGKGTSVHLLLPRSAGCEV